MNKVTIGNNFKYPEEIFGDPLSYVEESCREELLEELARLNKNSINGDKENIFIRTGSVKESKGSCYIEIGNTKVICGLYGPRGIDELITHVKTYLQSF